MENSFEYMLYWLATTDASEAEREEITQQNLCELQMKYPDKNIMKEWQAYVN